MTTECEPQKYLCTICRLDLEPCQCCGRLMRDMHQVMRAMGDDGVVGRLLVVAGV